MKILVIGSGGREHALVWKLAQSPHATQMWSAPGNAGIAQERLAKNSSPVECVNISAEDLPKLLAFAQEKKIELTVVGPDNPLALGIVDLFQQHGLKIWGVNQKAAQFESSKVFSQKFMEKYGIPTAAAGTFSDAVTAKKFCATLGGKCVVKADGLALGKGVLICTNQTEAEKAVDEIMVSKTFGAAGANVVIQEFLEGIEVSLHALCDGQTAKIFPTSQDHKRALDGDLGLNTGGMGTYSPTPFLNDAQLADTARQVLDPFMRGCVAEGIDYRGLLYPGVMLTKNGPKILEFNARFGDPETQVYLTRLENDLVELLDASVNGTLEKIELKWKPEASVCVVMASGGYPGNYEKGKPIFGLAEAAKLPGVKVFHAGTAKIGNEIVTNGGRVLGVTALGKDLKAAQAAAYAAVEKIHFDGAQFRRDIAAKALPRPQRTRCYICGDLLIPVPKGYSGRLEAKHATNDHVPPDAIFNDPKPSNLITVPCCNECNSKHSGFDERLRAFAAIEIGKNKGGEKILFEKVIGSTMKNARQKSFFAQLAESLRDKIVMTSEGPKKISVASFDKSSVIDGVADIAKGLLAKYYPQINYFGDHFEVLNIHNATLAKGHADEQLRIVSEIASKTPERVIGNFNEFRFWHYVEPNVRRGAWLLVFYESVTFFVIHHPKSYKSGA
jgi:phosphoribosylamine---glycine ligase